MVKSFLKKREIKKIRKAAWVIDAYSRNYFHWFNDVLPRILFLETSQNSCSILLPREFSDISYVKESLVLFNIDVLFITRDGLYIIDDLFIPRVGSSGCQDTVFFPKMVSVLRCQVSRKQTPTRKIFLLRPDNSTRSILSFDDTKRILLDNECEIVYTDKMTLREQSELFSSASHLISVHGAGLTNMLFMQPNTRVMEIRRRDDLLNYCYFFMAHTLGLKYYYFLADSAGISETVQPDQFLINSDLFSYKLIQFLYNA